MKLDTSFEKVARKNYERFIEIAALVGADYVGSNPGAVYRDRMDTKYSGIQCYLHHMKELMQYAFEKGLKGLTIEPMSCLAEPPSTPEEINYMLHELNSWQQQKHDAVPVYLCGDISHGLVDERRRVVADNYSLFVMQIPNMIEFHFKNTDADYSSTFGFDLKNIAGSSVDLKHLRKLIETHDSEWPSEKITGYLELPGPKLGRDYSDCCLEGQLAVSLQALRQYFDQGPCYTSALTGTVMTSSPA